MIKAADVLVEAAFDAVTGKYTDWCLAEHFDYDNWCKQMLSLGREIHTMTIEQMSDWLEQNPMAAEIGRAM